MLKKVFRLEIPLIVFLFACSPGHGRCGQDQRAGLSSGNSSPPVQEESCQEVRSQGPGAS